jgi:uncharacterized integral membrane protein (TIGR00697 family)
MRGNRWFPTILAVFVTSLIVSNIIAVKLFTLFEMTLPAAVILFPVAYIFGDVLTEVYGYARARQAIWIGFGCNLLAVTAIWLGGLLPADPYWNAGVYENAFEASRAYHAILGYSPRLLLASFMAYLVGEFLNSYVLAKLKIATHGRLLWVRTVTSTLIGQGADSAIFISIAFIGVIPTNILGMTIVFQWLFKSLYEAMATPLTYVIVNALKRAEGEDFFDQETDFNPIRLSIGNIRNSSE